jgi:RNA polymerase sigma-70 factor (ECF subfamily)
MDIAISRPESHAIVEREFHERFEAARPRLLGICRAVVGSLDAEDLVQETYLRGLERVGQLRDPQLFEAWLARIALNEARSLLRRQKRERDRLPALALEQRGHGDRELLQLVEALPLRQRACVALYYGYGYRLSEIARLLGISEINARTVLFRARRQLRRQWQEEQE